MPVTINDVAKAAGVSVSTVSKVLNHKSSISSATVDKVQQVIHDLNYTPNARAVSFARGDTRTIVYLTALGRNQAYRNPHMFDIMCGVHSQLADSGYSLTLVDTSTDNYPGESVSKIMAQKSADALLVHGSAIANEETASLIISAGFPHIIIGHPGFDSSLCWIDTNHGLAGQCAATHLISCDYTKAAFIGGRKTDHISNQRLKGFIGKMRDYGCHVPPEWIAYTDSGTKDSYQAAKKLLELPFGKRPQAIVCENSCIAVGVSNAIHDSGLKVPDEIAFLTFDSFPYSGIIDPPPTIVDIDVYDMGVQAGNMILRKLENPTLFVQSYTTLPVILQGETTRPVKVHRS